MRNFSKENQRTQGISYVPLRSCNSEKRFSIYNNQKTNEFIKVGQYKYREQDLLGKGFSSKVYKAVHEKN